MTSNQILVHFRNVLCRDRSRIAENNSQAQWKLAHFQFHIWTLLAIISKTFWFRHHFKENRRTFSTFLHIINLSCLMRSLWIPFRFMRKQNTFSGNVHMETKWQMYVCRWREKKVAIKNKADDESINKLFTIFRLKVFIIFESFLSHYVTHMGTVFRLETDDYSRPAYVRKKAFRCEFSLNGIRFGNLCQSIYATQQAVLVA